MIIEPNIFKVLLTPEVFRTTAITLLHESTWNIFLGSLLNHPVRKSVTRAVCLCASKQQNYVGK